MFLTFPSTEKKPTVCSYSHVSLSPDLKKSLCSSDFRALAVLAAFVSFACFEFICGEDLTRVSVGLGTNNSPFYSCKGFLYPFVKLILFPVFLHQLIIQIIPVL